METTACKNCQGTGQVPSPEGIRKIREAAGLRQADVAEAMRTSAAFVSSMERGVTAIPRSWRVYYEELEDRTDA